MPYKIIRLSADYRFAMAVSPAEAKPWSPGSRYFEYCGYRDAEPHFVETTENGAVASFSGIADGMGWGEKPEKNSFEDLEDIEKWLNKKEDEVDEASTRRIILVQHRDDLEYLSESINNFDDAEKGFIRELKWYRNIWIEVRQLPIIQAHPELAAKLDEVLN